MHLDWDVLVSVHQAFEKRLNSAQGHTMRIVDWSLLMIHCVQKSLSPVKCKLWRPLCIAAALQKWYEACLYELLERLVLVFGIRPWR